MGNYVHDVSRICQPDSVAVTQEERTFLMDNKLAPSNWQIYAGLCLTTADVGCFWHRSAGIYKESIPHDVTHKRNTQTTTFFFGQSFFHIISGDPDIMPEPDEYAGYLGIRQIWPIPALPVLPPIIMTTASVTEVAKTYWQLLGIDAKPPAWSNWPESG